MKTAIVFYSFGGATRKYAQAEAGIRNAQLFEIKEAKRRTIFGAFIKGCPAAMRQKSVPLKDSPIDLQSFDTIIIAAPVWAGFPAPAFNSIIDMLPAEKEVEIHLVSGSGDSSKCHGAVKSLIEKNGSKVTHFKDIKSDVLK